MIILWLSLFVSLFDVFEYKVIVHRHIADLSKEDHLLGKHADTISDNLNQILLLNLEFNELHAACAAALASAQPELIESLRVRSEFVEAEQSLLLKQNTAQLYELSPRLHGSAQHFRLPPDSCGVGGSLQFLSEDPVVWVSGPRSGVKIARRAESNFRWEYSNPEVRPL